MTATQLAKQGADVIVACRHETKGLLAAEAASPKKGATDGGAAESVDPAEASSILSPGKKSALGSVTFMKLDLADQESIRNFVTEFKFAYKKLNGLINNAAVMNCPFSQASLLSS